MAASPISPRPVQVRRPWNTLELLKGSLYLLWALDVLFLVMTISAVREHRASFKAVGKDTAPSIIAAQHIKAALAAMDANTANELLGPPGKMDAEVRSFDAKRDEAARAIVAAAENITLGEVERTPIVQLQVNTAKYEEMVQKARDLHLRNDPQTIDSYRDSAKLIDETLLPAADVLDKANEGELERAYQSASSGSLAARSGIAVIGFLFFLVLLRVQAFLSNRTRRFLNPALALGTLLVSGFLLYSMLALRDETRELKVAREDAFASIHALWQARAVAYALNADVSRYLIDDRNLAAHEKAFFEKADKLAKSQTGRTFREIAAEATEGGKIHGFSGYFADELNNITFPGERDAAADMLLRFNAYYDIIRQVRDLRESGKRDQAIALSTGSAPGQSNFVFHDFDDAIGRVIEINQTAFDTAVARGFEAVSNFEIKASIVALLLAALFFLGLRPRIREYS